MASHLLYNAVVLYEGLNLSGQLNETRIEYGAKMLNESVWGDDTEKNKAGILTASVNEVGFWDADAVAYQPDLKLFTELGANDKVVSVFPQGAADGARGFSLKTARATYSPQLEHGELFKFNAMGASRSRLMQTTVLTNSTETTSGSGTARQLTAVDDDPAQKLYAVLHVIAASGSSPTLDLIIQSDDAGGMPSADTRITFAQMNDIGAIYAVPVAGPITDDYWQAVWTIAGGTPSFTFVVGMAIMYDLGQTIP